MAELTSTRKFLNLNINELIKALRCHQYAKNSLIFLPLILGHYFKLNYFLETLLGFICFSLLASSVYLLNDLIDVESDRLHPTKRNRPLASGTLSIKSALILIPTLFSLAFLIASLLSSLFQLSLIAYYLLTLSYSLVFKRKALVDVLVLSGLYSMRILAGMIILRTAYSDWLILFSLFFFTSLAFVKRYVELSFAAQSGSNQKLPGRDYYPNQTQIISLFGITSGYLSTLIFALYINSDKAMVLYHHAKFLYFICPILLYWISYIWLEANKGNVQDDPVVFALKDKTSYLICFLIILIAIMATI